MEQVRGFDRQFSWWAGGLRSRYRSTSPPAHLLNCRSKPLTCSIVDLNLRNDSKLKDDWERIFGVLSGKDGELDPSGIMALSLSTSVIRSLKYCTSKLDALELLRKWGSLVESDFVLNRILPYSLYLINDAYARVRAEAVHTSAFLLTKINELPREDSKLFINYVLPRLNAVVHDPSSLVRIALASNVAVLAETAGRFLELASRHVLVGDKDVEEKETATLEISRQNYLRMELKELQETVQELVVTLLCDSDNNIKRALVQEDRLPKLCAFFGNQKASDVLLSHMITFLNDKTDWLLRAKFFECIPAAAAYIGWSSTLILKPLLQQGLRDFEEMVVFRTLSCLSCLAKLRLLQKPAVYELLQDGIPFLAHPNECLRISAVSFVSGVAKALNMADIHCKVMPMVTPYLKQRLIKLDQQAVVLRCLCEPVPRSVWDLVIRSPLMSDLMDFLRDKNLLRQLSPGQGLFGLGDLGGNEPNFLTGNTNTPTPSGMVPEHIQLKQFYQKLLNQGLTEEVEEKLLAFREIVMKMRKMKASVSDDLSPTETWKPGTVDLSCLSVTRRFADLTTSRRIRQRGRKNKMKTVDAGIMNEEWQQMFGTKPEAKQEPERRDETGMEDSGKNLVSENPIQQTQVTDAISDAMGVEATETEEDDERKDPSKSLESSSLVEVTETDEESVSVTQSVEHSTVIDTSPAMDTQIQLSSCRSNLTELVEWKRCEWHRAARFASSAIKLEGSADDDDLPRNNSDQDLLPPIEWRPEGRLVAHLHEHRGAVTKLAVHPRKRLFLSSSSDGTVKLWDSYRMEGKSMANRSRFTYTGLGDKVRCASFLSSGDRFVCSGDSCVVKVVPLERTSPTREKRSASPRKTSPDPSAKPSGTNQFQTDPVEEGPMLDLDTWTDGCTDLLVGVTHHGYLICWDLRSGSKPVWKCQNPSEHGLVTGFCLDRIRQQWACLATANGRLVTWDSRFQLPVNVTCHPSGQRVVRLWSAEGFGASSQFSQVWASLAGNGEIGLWDLETGTRSRALWPSENAPLSYQQISVPWHTGSGDSAVKGPLYKHHMVEGVEVLIEQKIEGISGKKSSAIYSGSAGSPADIQVTTWHRDSIADLLPCYTGEQWFLATASRDGVIKVWK